MYVCNFFSLVFFNTIPGIYPRGITKKKDILEDFILLILLRAKLGSLYLYRYTRAKFLVLARNSIRANTPPPFLSLLPISSHLISSHRSPTLKVNNLRLDP